MTSDIWTPIPSSPYETKPNTDFTTKGQLPQNGWGNYQSITGKISITDDTLYQAPENLGGRDTDTFISSDTNTEINLGGHTLRFDVRSNMPKFGVVNSGESLVFTGNGSLQIYHAPTGTASEVFNLKKENTTLAINVDDLWIEFMGQSKFATNIIKSYGQIDIKSAGNTVFLMGSKIEDTMSTVAIVELMAKTHDHLIDGKNIFFRYEDDFSANLQYGIWTSQTGGSLTIGSTSTELLQVANAKTALRIDAHNTETRLLADRIELIAPKNNGEVGIVATNYYPDKSLITMGKAGSEVLIGGFATAIALEENTNFVAGTSDSRLKLFETDGDLVSTEGSNISIIADQVILHGDISAENATATVDFGKSGFWNGQASNYNGTINAHLSDNTEWQLSGTSSLTSLVAQNAIIDLSNHDANGIPQLPTEGCISLTVDSFSGEKNRFILGTNLAEGLSSTITLSGVGDGANHTQYVAVNDINPTLDVSTIKETLFATVDGQSDIVFVGVEELSSKGLTLLTPGIRSETTDDGTINWFLTPIGSETRPGYTPQAMRQSVDAGYFLWRSMDEGTRERFGDLRNGAKLGMWGRISAGKLSHSGFKTDYVTYRLGFDGAPSNNTRVGVLVEHLQGNIDGRWGDGDASLTSVALYGLWSGENGAYFDAGLRLGRYDEEYINKTSLQDNFNYKATAYGAWVEAGHAFNLPANLFITPHVGLNIGRINGKTFTTHVGIEGTADAIESAILSYGLDIGRTTETWTAAVTLVGKTELLGDMNFRAATNEGAFSEHWSYADSWLEAGLAAAFRPTEAFEAWLNIKRSFCSEVDTDWSVNAGLRHRF